MSIVDLHTRLRGRDDPRRPAPVPGAFAALDNAIRSLDQLADVPGFGFASVLARSYRSTQAELLSLKPGSPMLLHRLTEVRRELQELSESLSQLATMINSRKP